MGTGSGSDYGSSGTVKFFGPFLYRSEFDATTEEEECERALRHLRLESGPIGDCRAAKKSRRLRAGFDPRCVAISCGPS